MSASCGILNFTFWSDNNLSSLYQLQKKKEIFYRQLNEGILKPWNIAKIKLV